MIHVTCRLTAKNRDQLRNPALGNRVWANVTFFMLALAAAEYAYMKGDREIEDTACMQNIAGISKGKKSSQMSNAQFTPLSDDNATRQSSSVASAV